MKYKRVANTAGIHSNSSKESNNNPKEQNNQHQSSKMKTISISALILATATSILAAPSPKVSALEPLQLTNLNAAIPSTTPPQTCLLSFAVKDPNTNTDTKCSAYWSIGMPGNKTYNCSDKAYQLHLPNGIYDIEKFDLGVSRADGSETGRATVSGDSWKCEKQEYPMARCKWDGIFSLDVAPSA